MNAWILSIFIERLHIQFAYVEDSLHLKDKACLIITDNLLIGCLISVCKSFTKNIFYLFHKEKCVILIFVGSLYGLGFRVTRHLLKDLCTTPSVFGLWNNFRGTDINISLKLC